MTRYELESDDGPFVVEVVPNGDGFRVNVSGKEYLVKLKRQPGQDKVVAEVGDKPVSVALYEADPHHVQLAIGGERLTYRRKTAIPEPPAQSRVSAPAHADVVIAPMPGKVISSLVKNGEKVRAGDPLVVLESMKMEVAVRADRDAEVAEVLVGEGEAVKRGQPLVRLG
jgi:biotin carboxyl carrier protein